MISIVCQRLEGRSPTLMIHGGYKTRLFVKSDGYKQWKYGSNEDVFREDESLTLPDRAQSVVVVWRWWRLLIFKAKCGRVWWEESPSAHAPSLLCCCLLAGPTH